MECPACGAENAGVSRFCSKCGQPIPESASEQARPLEEAAPSAPPPVAAQVEPVSVIEPTPSAAAPAAARSKRRFGWLIAAIIAVVFVAATGIAVYVLSRGANEARQQAAAGIENAEALIEDAALAAEPGSPEEDAVSRAESELDDARAAFDSGWFLSAGPYEEALASADKAADRADEVLVVLQADLDEAELMREDGRYEEALGIYVALVEQHPRSRFASEAVSAAVEMATVDVPDGVSSDVEELDILAGVIALCPGETPTEVSAEAQACLLRIANSKLGVLNELAVSNANWAAAIRRKGAISGDVVWNFQMQEYDAGDVKKVKEVAAKLPALGQPEQMRTLFALIGDATQLCADCRSVANNPSRTTSTSKVYSNAQIDKVRDNAAEIRKKVDAAKEIVAGIASAS